MNKKTVSLSLEEYKAILEAMTNGFEYTDAEGKQHKFRKNPQLAMVCQTEATTGMRISDILNLKLSSIRKDGSRYALDVKEKKTGKERNFTIPKELYTALREYAVNNDIKKTEPLFSIGERAVQKQIGIAAEHLGLEGISSHSFRKTFAVRIYTESGYNIELVRTLLQHSSTVTTQRYLGMGTKQIETALQDVVDAFLFI